MSFSVNCWLPGAEIWRTTLCKRRFWVTSWKAVAASLLWRWLEVVHLLVAGKVWVYTHSCLCFLNFEVPKVRLCPVSAPPPLNACGKEKFLNFPCTAYSRAVHLPGSPQHQGPQGLWGARGLALQNMKARLWGFFRAADHWGPSNRAEQGFALRKLVSTERNRDCWRCHPQVLQFCFLPGLQPRCLGEAWIECCLEWQ